MQLCVCWLSSEKSKQSAVLAECPGRNLIIIPRLADLLWLPVSHRIQYKTATVRYNLISGYTPQCLAVLSPVVCTPSRSPADSPVFHIMYVFCLPLSGHIAIFCSHHSPAPLSLIAWWLQLLLWLPQTPGLKPANLGATDSSVSLSVKTAEQTV